MSLKSKLVLRAFAGLLLLPALLFIPAGSLKFWRGWAFMAVALTTGVLGTVYFYKRDPKFIERRLLFREKVSEQKLIMRFGRLVFLSSFLLPGLDYRLGWSRQYLGPVPPWLTLLSLALILGSYLFIIWVFQANRFAASIIRVEAGQAVISTGPYRMVRHPMYFGVLVLWLFVPLALGSYFASPAFALVIPVLVFRLLNEEKVLRRDLPGYDEYCRHTPFRLIPFLW
jgi:protein-S-isoprenylcysteine O-methyltransferase Ste14